MTAARLAEEIASTGLGTLTEPVHVPGVLVDDLVHILRDERILGVAVNSVVTDSAEATNTLFDAHDEVMTQSMRVEIMLIRVAQILDHEDIDYRLLKGSAIAHSFAREPSERSFRDVDLLVPGESMSSVVQLLVSEGATRLQPELRPGYDERFGKSVTMKLDGVEVDLHRLLCPGPFGVWMRPNELFLLQDELSIGGQSIRTLDATNHLIHACYHVALGQIEPVLANLRDIGLLATALDRIDLDRFDDTVRQWRGAAVIKRAVALVQKRLDVDLPDELVRYLHVPIDSAELTAVKPYLTNGDGGRFAALAPSTLRALPLGDRAAYALAVGLPAGSDPLDRARSILKRRK